MNASSFRGAKERAVFDPVDFARSFAKADAEKNCSFLGLDGSGVLPPAPESSKFFPGIFRHRGFPNRPFVSISHMLLLCNPLQIAGGIVRFNPIFMVNDVCKGWFIQPEKCYEAVKKAILSCFDVTVCAHLWGKWKQSAASFSKNFPAPRNSESMVIGSVLDSIVEVAQHGRLSGGYELWTSLPEMKGNR